MPITFTNKFDLPAALAAAIVSDEKSKAGQFSITELMAPPRIRRLMQQSTVEVDVSDRLWAMMGKGMHRVLEDYGSNTEMQLVARLDGVLISGTIDASEGDVLRDWKLTSVMAGTRQKDWEVQLNCYSWLYQRAFTRVLDDDVARRSFTAPHEPRVPKALQVTAIYRDFIGARAGQGDYPKSQTQNFDLPMWEVDEAEKFIRGRLLLHLDAESLTLPMMPPLCTPDERWHREDTFAVVKGANKRATRVFTSHADAVAFCEHQNVGGLRIDHRPGADVRCERYCTARTVCPHGAAIAAALASSQVNQSTTTTNNTNSNSEELPTP